MTTETTKTKATGKSQYISQSVYKGTRTRSGASAELYRLHAVESLKRLEKFRIVGMFSSEGGFYISDGVTYVCEKPFEVPTAAREKEKRT